MKSVGARFRHIVHLRSTVATLIDGIGKRVNGNFRDGVQPQDQIGRESAIQIGQRIIRFQAVYDVAIGKGGEAVELDVAIPV